MKGVVIALVALALIAFTAFFFWRSGENTVEGVVVARVASAQTLTIETDHNGQIILALESGTAIEDAEETPIVFSALKEGDRVKATGTYTNEETFVPRLIRILSNNDNEGHARNVELSVGEEERIGDLMIGLIRVLEDYRCGEASGTTAACEEAGGITAEVALRTTGATTTATSFNIAEDEVPYAYGSYFISIVKVSPPARKERIPADEYEVTFRIDSQELPLNTTP